MFDYKISKHPHFDEACRAFALRHNMAKLAERAGMNVQTLRNKLNPDQPHQLNAPEIWLLTDLTEDSTLIAERQSGLHGQSKRSRRSGVTSAGCGCGWFFRLPTSGAGS